MVVCGFRPGGDVTRFGLHVLYQEAKIGPRATISTMASFVLDLVGTWEFCNLGFKTLAHLILTGT